MPSIAPLKQRAWDAAVAALRKVREEASYGEMETAAAQAVQPMIREYEHQQACQRILGRVYIFDATREEEAAAKEALRKALAALPIGATQKQLETAEETVLVRYKAAVATRKEKARRESEKQAQRRAAASKADLQLDHVARYLEQEYEFDGGYSEMHREAERLRPLIRENADPGATGKSGHERRRDPGEHRRSARRLPLGDYQKSRSSLRNQNAAK